jgi:oligopeptidase B
MARRVRVWIGIGIALSAGAVAYARRGEPVKPPMAEKRPRVDVVHGDRRQDDYFWLREKGNPAVRAYLEAENEYASRMTERASALRGKLYDEMVGRIQESDVSAPYRQGDYLYYSRTEKGKQYPIHCRRKGTEAAPEEVILDLNDLAKGRAFLGLGAFEPSDDGAFLAYSLDTVGFRQYTLRVKDLRAGADLPDTAQQVGSVAWASDGKTIFYTTEDRAKRQYRLHRHALGSVLHDLVFEEPDELFRIGIHRTRSRAYLLLSIESHTTSEVRYLPADDPRGTWKIVAPRVHEREYEVDHRDDRFYVRVNDTGRNFRVVSAPVSDPGSANWTEIVPHRSDVMLEGLELFASHWVLLEREGGLPQMRITDFRTGASHRLAFPEAAYLASPQNNRVWATKTLRYAYQSLVTPPSVYDYDMDAKTSALRKRIEVLGGYDPSRYVTERIHATAEDGTRVPATLLYRKDLKRDGHAPLLLGGYGSYGYSYPVAFSSNRFSLVDRGAVVALAHVRGGGEMGKAWHDQGRMMSKMNTFTDFIAVAEHLVAERYTSPSRIVAEGGSAGGLLMGAVANLRPGLFRAMVSHVPFVDVINTMLDSSLPLTVGEFEEWGNPSDEAQYKYLKRYCPYTNLAARAYPAMLVKTSLEDSQVMYWEPAKYVAKMRTLRTDSNPLLLVTNMGAGHGGSSGRYDRLKEIAFDYAFMLDQWGIRK